MFAGKAGAYPSETPFSQCDLDKAPALLTNIRLEWIRQEIFEYENAANKLKFLSLAILSSLV